MAAGETDENPPCCKKQVMALHDSKRANPIPMPGALFAGIRHCFEDVATDQLTGLRRVVVTDRLDDLPMLLG